MSAPNQALQQLFYDSRPQHTHRPHSDAESEGCACVECGHPTTATADICEKCGAWQLENQCCFCYAPFESGQRFCSKCGNPPTGITCKQCGEHSIYDVCQNCETPLSKRAAPIITALRESNEAAVIEQLAKALHEPATGKTESSTLQNDLQQLADYYRDIAKAEPQVKKNSFTGPETDADFTSQLEELQLQQHNNSVSEEPTHAELMKKIAELQAKVFADNQSARLFYTSIKVLIPKAIKNRRIIGWLCNFAGVLHTTGPALCGDPSRGGRYVYENEEAVWEKEEL